MHDVMASHIERGAVPGLVTLVSRRGEVHVDAIGMKAAGGSDPMRRDTILRIASMTEPVTPAAAIILVEESKLRLDESVNRLFRIPVYKRTKTIDNTAISFPVKEAYGVSWRIPKKREGISKPDVEGSFQIDKDKGTTPRSY